MIKKISEIDKKAVVSIYEMLRQDHHFSYLIDLGTFN